MRVWGSPNPPQMAEPERPPCILVVDADPGVATGLTRELQYGFGREYLFLATLSARSGLDILERLTLHRAMTLGQADSWSATSALRQRPHEHRRRAVLGKAERTVR
jgi:hypothetical protein